MCFCRGSLRKPSTKSEEGDRIKAWGICQLSLSSWSMCSVEQVAGGNQQHRILDSFPILLLNGALVHVFCNLLRMRSIMSTFLLVKMCVIQLLAADIVDMHIVPRRMVSAIVLIPLIGQLYLTFAAKGCKGQSIASIFFFVTIKLDKHFLKDLSPMQANLLSTRQSGIIFPHEIIHVIGDCSLYEPCTLHKTFQF